MVSVTVYYEYGIMDVRIVENGVYLEVCVKSDIGIWRQFRSPWQ